MTQPAFTLGVMTWHEGPLLGFDLETTGLDPQSDLPVQVAFVRWDRRGPISREAFLVDPGCEVPSVAQAIHGISTERARREGRPLPEATARMHALLEQAQSELIPVVVMNATFDITIVAGLFSRFELKPVVWRALVDPLVMDRQVDRFRSGRRCLEVLCRVYGVPFVTPHDAGSDAVAALGISRAIAGRYPEIAGCEICELTRAEEAWHRSWATEYDCWSRANGRPGLAPDEFSWPLRRIGHLAA